MSFSTCNSGFSNNNFLKVCTLLCLLFSFSFIVPSTANPTTCDTLKKEPEVKWFYWNQILKQSSQYQLVNIEKIEGFQHYEFNKEAEFFLAGKGNVGQATRHLEFRPRFVDGFSLFGYEPHIGTSFSHESIKFYKPEHVFSTLFFASGPYGENNFYFNHNQRLGEDFVFGIRYRVIDSSGRFSRTGTSNTNWYINVDYGNSQKRYGISGGLIINRINNEESGGLKDRFQFEQNSSNDFGVLSNADVRNLESKIFFHQYYSVGQSFDVIEDDTLIVGSKIPARRLFHEFSLTSGTQEFFDKSAPNKDFFNFPPVNANQTLDSTRVVIMENAIGLSGLIGEGKDRNFFYKGYVKHRFVDVNQQTYWGEQDTGDGNMPVFDSQRNKFNQVLAGFEFDLNFSAGSTISGLGSYTAWGKNSGDLNVEACLTMSGKESNLNWQIMGGLYRNDAPYFLSHFFGNYVSWNNSFEKQSVLRGGLGVKTKPVDFEANAYLIQNVVFFGNDALPVQNANSFGLITLRGTVAKKFGPFHTKHDILLQWAGTDNFERFPLLLSYHTFFFNFSLFRKAMFLNVGFDLFYNTPYKPMGYMPVVRHFYVQDEYQSSHVLTADFFATFRVGRARFFLKVQNLGSHLDFVPQVYQVPFYPVQDFATKFGVKWLFFD